MDGDIDQISLILLGFFAGIAALLLLLDWLEPGAEHPVAPRFDRISASWRRLRRRRDR